jgi:predicted transcriptional regulator
MPEPETVTQLVQNLGGCAAETICEGEDMRLTRLSDRLSLVKHKVRTGFRIIGHSL